LNSSIGEEKVEFRNTKSVLASSID